MRYFVDNDGRYIGGTDGDPLSNNEVPKAPDDARQVWNGSDYDPISVADLDAAKDAEAGELADPKKAFAALLELLWDNSAEIQAAFPNPNGRGKFKQAAVTAYRAKL